ncbi:MAG TPA: phosphate ABC transporter permease subunit PstC [Bacteroidales bacterium]|nr:phosphate ABC transporter permease subunit PstC [Bacteroidales bacterium]
MLLNIRKLQDQTWSFWIKIALAVVILLPLFIGLVLFFRSLLILETNGLQDLLFSSNWRPMRGEFGFFPFIISSLWVTVLGVVITAPICLFSALYLTQYGSARLLRFMQPIIDILAGIPSVIYGVWGVLIIVPLVRDYLMPLFGIQGTGFSILAGSIVVAVMLIPFVVNILIEVLRTVPVELTEASLSLGANKWQTVKLVVLRKAFPGIVSAFGLGLSRAFGETIAVLMVVGNVITMPNGVFDPGYPLPALIANNYGEMMSIPMYDSALMFAALILLVVVMVSNFLSRSLIVVLEKRI